MKDEGKRIVLFGTGGYADQIFNSLRSLPIAYCVDNNENRWGGSFHGLPICSPDALANENCGQLFIIVASSYYWQIKRQLNELGFEESRHFLPAADVVYNDASFYTDSRKKALLYGNCQMAAIQQYMLESKSFQSQYVMYPKSFITDFFPAGLSDVLLQSLEVFVYHTVGPSFAGESYSTDHILSRLPSNCRIINVTNAYFAGYHPQQLSIRSPNGRFPYGDQNIVSLIQERHKRAQDIEEMIRELSRDNYYNPQQVKEKAASSIAELAKREAGADVTIADFIEACYLDEHLFYTVNHPNFKVIRELAARLLGVLGINADDINRAVIDRFGHFMVPIYPSVVNGLELSFIQPEHKYPFYLNTEGLSYTFAEYMKEYALSYLEWGAYDRTR